jgi:hypothetical protein
MTQALQFTSDMKLGHYMKIPPRIMFWCQIIATVVAATTQLGVQQWYVPRFCKSQTGKSTTILGQDVRQYYGYLRAAPE